MAKKWTEVQSSPEYQALEPAAKEKARQQYFQQIIVPQLSADKVEGARKQFDTQTLAPEVPEQTWGSAVKNVAQATGKLATGIPASILGDVAGLGALAYDITANAVTDPFGAGDPGKFADPAAVSDFVKSKLTYQPEDQQSTSNKLVDLPGKVVMGAGEGLAKVTGTEDIPLLGDIVRAGPLALASLAGVRSGTGRVPASRLAPEPTPQETFNARSRSTVDPEGVPVAPTPPPAVPQVAGPGPRALPAPAAQAAPALPAPGSRAVAVQGAQQPPGPATPPGAGPRAQGPTPEMRSANPAPPAASPPPRQQRIVEKKKALKDATPEELYQDAVDTLLKNNVQLTRGQRGLGLAAKQMQSLGRAADTLLGSSKKKLEQMQDFTAAVFSKVGVKARNATADAMAELKRKTQDDYESAHADAHVNFDGELIAELAELQGKARRTSGSESAFDQMMDHIRRNATSDPTKPGSPPRMSAEMATKIRSELGLMENSQHVNIKTIAKEVKDALDAAAERSTTPQKAALLKEARGRYHFMKQIEDAIVHGKNGSFISPQKLLNVINRKRNKNEAVYGAGDQALVKLAESGKKVLPDDVGDSGSATRHGDIFKLGAVLHDPVGAAKLGGTIFGGRVANEFGSRKGTPNYQRAQAEKDARGSSPTRVVLQVGTTQNKETQEQKRRRLAAEALRR